MKSLFTILIIIFSQFVYAQQKDSLLSYPIAVKFQSICCGVPDGTPLRRMVLSFKKKNKLKHIASYHIGPLGREGEYIVGFPLEEMTQKQKNYFIKKIKMTVPKLKDKGKAIYEEPFSVSTHNLPSNLTIERIDF